MYQKLVQRVAAANAISALKDLAALFKMVSSQKSGDTKTQKNYKTKEKVYSVCIATYITDLLFVTFKTNGTICFKTFFLELILRVVNITCII